MDTPHGRIGPTKLGIVALVLLALEGCGVAGGGSFSGGSSGSAGASGSSGSTGSSGSSGSSGSTGGRSGSSGASSGGVTTDCVGTSVNARQQPLDLYVMLDRSTSMADTAGSSSKWSAVTSALSSFVGQAMDGTSVGLQYFPIMDWTSGTGSSCDATAYAAPAVEIGPLSDTASRIRSSMSSQNLLPNTPTSAALQGAIDHARARLGTAASASHAVAVVLATDGEPTVCDTDLGHIDGIAAAGAGATPAVKTFVIGVGNLKANLDGIAAAGGTGAAFIVDTSGNVGAQFLKALNDVRSKAIGCKYAIPAAPSGQTLDYEQVNVEYQPGGVGSRTAFTRVADATGCGTRAGAWHYDDGAAPTSIVLCPTACSTVQADTAASVQIVLGCKQVREW